MASKNKRIRMKQVWGSKSSPSSRSNMRQKHINHIINYLGDRFGLSARVTPGKLNKSGKFIKKPDWGTGHLEFEPNPDAAVHELGHLFLSNAPLKMYQNEMDSQFGYVISEYGYMKQKSSLFEILPMAMENKIRRRLGLPAYSTGLPLKDKPRTCVETGERYGVIVGDRELIRLSRNLDKGCLDRLQMIDNGELVYNPSVGWTESDSIDARINRRARLKATR